MHSSSNSAVWKALHGIPRATLGLAGRQGAVTGTCTKSTVRATFQFCDSWDIDKQVARVAIACCGLLLLVIVIVIGKPSNCSSDAPQLICSFFPAVHGSSATHKGSGRAILIGLLAAFLSCTFQKEPNS